MSHAPQLPVRCLLLSYAIAVCAWAVLVQAGEAVPDAPPPKPTKPTVATQDCLGSECHGALLGRKVLHGPVAQQKCLDCHTYEDATQHRFKRSAGSDQGCTACHSMKDKALSHAPVQEGLCTSCHDPHGSNLPKMLVRNAPDLCLSCHKNVRDSLSSSMVVHGAMTQDGSCLSCHVAHVSKLPKLQRQTQPQQCLTCHDRPLRAKDGRTLTDMAALLRDNPEHHGPIRLGACTACHPPHVSDQAKLLAAAYPPDFYAPFKEDLYQLCFTCHTPDLARLPEGTAATGFTDGKKNLHWVHVNQEKGRTCRACHEVHASRQPFHIRDSVPFGPGGWEITIKYTQTPTGGRCSSDCHGERSYDHGSRPRSIPFTALMPKGQALARLESGQPPPAATAPVTGTAAAADRRELYPVPAPPFTPGVFPCTGCHDAGLVVNTQRRTLQKPHADIRLHHDEEHRWCLDCHNAQNRDVLRSAAGEPIPFAESYRLCGQCHGLQYRDWKAGVHGKRTGAWDGRKDYLLCVHCHDPHAPKFKPLAPLPPPIRPDARKEVP